MPIQKGLSINPFPRFPCHQFFDRVSSKSLTIQQNHRSEDMNKYVITSLAISPSKQNEHPGALLKSCPPRSFPREELSCSSCPFRVMPADHAEPSLNRPESLFCVN